MSPFLSTGCPTLALYFGVKGRIVRTMSYSKKIKFLILLIFQAFILSVNSQNKNELSTIESKTINEKLSTMDFQDVHQIELKVVSQHVNKGTKFIYLQQYLNDLPIFGATANMAIKDISISHFENLIDPKSYKLVEGLMISPIQCLEHFARAESYPITKITAKVEKSPSGNGFVISSVPFATEGARISKTYHAKNGQIILSWVIEFESSLNADDFQLVFSGVDGSLLERINHTIYCKYENHEGHLNISQSVVNTTEFKSFSDQKGLPAYRVFAAPLEAPSFGDRSLVETEGDLDVSPYGWHDTNGVLGAEYFITRGNNVHAFQDSDDNNASAGDEPQGGDSLFFDFPFDPKATPEQNGLTDVTNLFYWINYLHDWSYRLGFNELAGNFQFNNYGKGGVEGDDIKAHTLDGGDTGNANFSAPKDGSAGRMQMYKWAVGNSLEITEPPALKGMYETGAAGFGPYIEEFLDGKLVIANDGLGVTSDGCQAILNDSQIIGNIALLDRGECHFSKKVHAVQLAGARAAIVCNNVDNDGVIGMGAGDSASLVKIPSLLISKEDCNLIKVEISKGNDVKVLFTPTTELSSGFDNGIIVHEFGHGISIRLAGGASNSGCLNNDEQLGEGWSDFFALVLTRQAIDRGEKSRGIGSYVLGETPNGRGIRRYPYSTDLNINPQIHSHIRATTRPHPLGEIWAQTLWDLYWEFNILYGYDQTWRNTEAGNVKMVQLVIDGLKIQRCNAGILEARSAILDADLLNNSGVNQCLIWKVFARRGLGFDAFGGSSNSRYDNVDGFELHPSCRNQIDISKTMNQYFDVGDTLEVVIDLENNLGRIAYNLRIEDEIPEGMSLISKSNNEPFVKNGNALIFQMDSIASSSKRKISYSLTTGQLAKANLFMMEDFEAGNKWLSAASVSGLSGWQLNTLAPLRGKTSIILPGDTITGQSTLTMPQSFRLNGLSNGFSFVQSYDTQLGLDGGVVQISTDKGSKWETIAKDKFILNSYNDDITFDSRYTNTIQSFTGKQNQIKTTINLTDYSGKDVLFRFRFFHQEFNESVRRGGWSLDDVQLGELKAYSTKVCVEWDTDTRCDNSNSVMNYSDNTVSVHDEILASPFDIKLYPNPVSSNLTIEIQMENSTNINLSIMDVSGIRLKSQIFKAAPGFNTISFDVSQFPIGAYWLKMDFEGLTYNSKFIKMTTDN